MNRDKIVKFCNDYLKAGDFKDDCVNGLQVEGKDDVRKIVTGVTFSRKLIDRAIARKADMIMVHHGIFGNAFGSPPGIVNILRQRLHALLLHDINLCGYHLPLDAHPIIGNNVSICKKLGLTQLEKFKVGFIGSFSGKMPVESLVGKVAKMTGSKPYLIQAGPQIAKKVAVVSGGASPYFMEALESGVDTYITGDVRESTVRPVEEAGMNFINAGHYNTEKMGIENLGNLVAKKFKVKVEFIDIPCDI